MHTVMANNTCEGMDEVGLLRYVIINLVFFIGVAGNLAALWILYKSAKTRNKKHVLLLRCLAVNDLVAEVGMFSIITLQKYKLIPVYWICVGFVLLRAFGIGSGCVAFVMALERWLALTRPFYYQQLVTYRVLKIFVFSLWSGGALLTYLPLLGFGLYYNGKCCRYRDATELRDQIYAYMFLVFGTALCLCIAFCNLTVIWELSKIRPHGRVLMRRVSRSTMNSRVMAAKYQTPEEIAFAKLMAIICIIFVVCWAPQMISIPLAQFWKGSTFDGIFAKMANFLMCTYFTLDPYVYVLQRYIEKKKIALGCCWPRRSTGSITTSSITAGTPTSVLLNPPSFTSPSIM
ncbi:prostaglandin E2 receptor EP2 subtype [Tribolium madens]|uniref:prostaglandin E2 receptor EP2 subtype n=1 Tax=Tribolium madens TaxID=41895 RepID=UPI001CF730C7|nr:prostaglandin E2 receptor EP2 subtype [Tribolium madens]